MRMITGRWTREGGTAALNTNRSPRWRRRSIGRQKGISYVSPGPALRPLANEVPARRVAVYPPSLPPHNRENLAPLAPSARAPLLSLREHYRFSICEEVRFSLWRSGTAFSDGWGRISERHALGKNLVSFGRSTNMKELYENFDWGCVSSVAS